MGSSRETDSVGIGRGEVDVYRTPRVDAGVSHTPVGDGVASGANGMQTGSCDVVRLSCEGGSGQETGEGGTLEDGQDLVKVRSVLGQVTPAPAHQLKHVEGAGAELCVCVCVCVM